MNVILLIALAAVHGMSTTAEEYHRRSFHAPTPGKRLELLNQALDLNPNYVPALRSRALVQSLLGDKKAALADAVKAADLCPDDPELNQTAGILAEELKDHARATAFHERALRVEPRDPLLRARLIDSLIKLRRIDDALQHADYLVRRHPHEDFPYSARAEVYEWADRYADAAKDLSLLIQRHPEDPDHAQDYLRRCINYRCVGDGQKALADAEKAIQLRGATAYALSARGCSYEVLGQLDKAIDDFQKAAELEKDAGQKPYYTIWSCLLLRKLNRRADADKLVKDYVKPIKDDKWIIPVLRYLAGEIPEDKVFLSAKSDDPETNRNQLCEAYYYVGAAYLADGNLDRAETLFKQCVEQRVNNFYEHGFAIRDLRVIQKLREKKANPAGATNAETGPR